MSAKNRYLRKFVDISTLKVLKYFLNFRCYHQELNTVKYFLIRSIIPTIKCVQELLSSKEDDRNWKGILISIACIIAILISVLVSVAILTPKEKSTFFSEGRR